MPFPRALLALEKPNSLVEAALVMNAGLFGVIWISKRGEEGTLARAYQGREDGIHRKK